MHVDRKGHGNVYDIERLLGYSKSGVESILESDIRKLYNKTPLLSSLLCQGVALKTSAVCEGLFEFGHKVFITLIVLMAFLQDANAREATDRPNVIIVFLDDSGWGDYGFTGNPVVETPNIDRLALGGVIFSQFYVTASACSASRYSLLTGRWPSRSGLGGWVIGPDNKNYIHPREITIADALRTAGYKTTIIGKWHLGTPNNANNYSREAFPLSHGFDSWIGTNVSHDYQSAMLIKSESDGESPIPGYRIIADKIPSKADVCGSLTGLYTNATVSFIKDNKDRPFFVYLAHNMPHLGLHVSKKRLGSSRRGLFGDVMAEVDDCIGEIVKATKECGIEKNTIIIFSSDNGPWVLYQDAKESKYGDTRLQVGSAAPFRDGKGSTWEGGYRVPCIWNWPGVIEPRREISPSNTCDILPTVASLAAVNIPMEHRLDGRNIEMMLTKKDNGVAVKEFLHLYHYKKNQIVAVRKGPWKLVIETGTQTNNPYGNTASEITPMLFNVENDVGERIDLAHEQPLKVAELMQVIREERERIESDGILGSLAPGPNGQ